MQDSPRRRVKAQTLQPDCSGSNPGFTITHNRWIASKDRTIYQNLSKTEGNTKRERTSPLLCNRPSGSFGTLELSVIVGRYGRGQVREWGGRQWNLTGMDQTASWVIVSTQVSPMTFQKYLGKQQGG